MVNVGLAMLAGIPREGGCDLLGLSNPDAHGVGLTRYWGGVFTSITGWCYLPGFSTVKLFVFETRSFPHLCPLGGVAVSSFIQAAPRKSHTHAGGLTNNRCLFLS